MRALPYLVLLFTTLAAAQARYTITGDFPQGKEKEIALRGYGFNEMTMLSKTTADATGRFSLSYPQEYVGAALLEVRDGKSVIVLLDHDDFAVRWANFEDLNSLTFTGSPNNIAFAEGLAVYKDSEAKKAALAYLGPLYADEPDKQQFFASELKTQEHRMDLYLSNLPESPYAVYYLMRRRFLADMPQTPARFKERISQYEQEFRALDFGSTLVRTGLFKELLENYFILLESAGADSYTRINKSVDEVLTELKLRSEPGLRQDVAEYLFKLFEQRSLFPAAEHVALSMLGDSDCTIDGKREALFEQYRKMAKGNTAPDIVLVNASKPYKKLSDIPSKYKLVVFGAGWCPTCREEAPKLKESYKEWKSRGLEVVYISLDTDMASFRSFSANFPWVSATDLKSWDGAAPRDYFVSATPTIYLLDAANRIMLKPISPAQVSAWLDANK